MHFLVQTAPFPDEALESYFLRLAHENGFTDYVEFIDMIWQSIDDEWAKGALPLRLDQLDLNHAKQVSGFRVQAIKLIEQWAMQPPGSILRLSWKNTHTRFGSHVAFCRDELHVPKSFLRDEGIPVCTECLKENAYSRYWWYIKPYLVCHRHKCDLVFQCSSCCANIDFRTSEDFLHCECGALISSENLLPEPSELRLSDSIAHSGGEIIGLYHWWLYTQKTPHTGSTACFWTFVDTLQESLDTELSSRVKKARLQQTLPFNETPFRNVFANLIAEAFLASTNRYQFNPILSAIVVFLQALVAKNPRAKAPNIGDLLLSSIETAGILGTNTEQVFRLYEEGYLQRSTRLNKHQYLSPTLPVFFLRDVIVLSEAFSGQPSNPSIISGW